MEAQTLELELRTTRGKGPARQLRAAGKVPGVFYGPGAEAIAVSLCPKALRAALRTDYRRNVLLKVQLDGKEELAMLKDLDVHPVNQDIIHVDLYRVTTSSKVRVFVPLKTKSRALGVQKGGKLKVTFRDLPVDTTPEKIPASIVVDVAALDLNESLTVADLELPEGVSVRLDSAAKLILIGGEQKKRGADAEENKDAQAA